MNDEAHDDFQPLDELTDHEYDGIREYDNPTPSWWSWIFFGTFVFSILYFAYYHVGTAGRTLDESLVIAVADNQKKLLAKLPSDFAADEATMRKYMHDDQWVGQKWRSYAQSIFSGRCATCHGGNGEGGNGPNLTDDYYIHIKSLEDIIQVVTYGAANGNMPAHESLLSPYDIVFVSTYVAKLRGNHLDGPRGEEGEKIDDWPAPTPSIDGPDAVEPPL